MAEENKNTEYTWTPSLKWIINVFICTVAVSAVIFFLLNFILKDYMRSIPEEVTPWLAKTEVKESK